MRGRRRHLSISADLTFEVTTPEGRAVGGRLRGQGSDLTLTVDDPWAFAGRRDAAGVREIADQLAARGLSVHVQTSHGDRLLSLGAVRAPLWQRPFTRSRHLRVLAVRGVTQALRGRAEVDEGVLPTSAVSVPSTPFPLAPTFLRRPVRKVTTTHDPHQGGMPRLVTLPNAEGENPGRMTYWLQQEVTTIGSDPACDIVLPGLAGVHAEIRHDSDDEFVLVARHRDTTLHGARVRQQRLRTSSRVGLGAPDTGHQLAFVREEFADHGRPFGGRVGGEAGRQLPQTMQSAKSTQSAKSGQSGQSAPPHDAADDTSDPA